MIPVRAARVDLLGGLLPPVEELLALGGDHRIRVEAGENRYGCRPRPLPPRWQLGSSTASEISEAALAAAERQRERLGRVLLRRPAYEVHAEEATRIRLALRAALGIEAVDPAVEVVLGASGTDLHLYATALAAGAGRAGGAEGALRVVGPEAGETGTGVPAALQARHASEHPALGGQVVAGSPLGDGPPPELREVRLRDGQGAPRPVEAIDAEAEALCEEALAAGRPVLLVLADVSKTGLLGPSAACGLALARRHPGRLFVLVDACQLRLSAATLRAYLHAGALVAVTGSKFAGGPPFSGALLLPAEVIERLRGVVLPPGLGRYGARADWPASLGGADVLPRAANLGLLVRWEAALVELRAFRALPPSLVEGFLGRFAAAAGRHLWHHAGLEPIAGAPLERPGLAAPRDAAAWDRHPTLFPFLVAGPGGAPLGPEAAGRVHRALLHPEDGGPAIQLGQPVAVRGPAGATVGALRLCASARLCVEASASPAAEAAVIARALAALDRAAAQAG